MAGITERLADYGRACRLRALQLERQNEDLQEQIAGLAAKYTLPALRGSDSGGNADMLSFAGDMKADEQKGLERQIATNDQASKIYARRDEFAQRGFLYLGEAEINSASYRVDEVPVDLVADASGAGLAHFASADLDFDQEGTGEQGM